LSRSISPYERFGQFLPQEDANLEEYTWNASDTITGLAHRKYGDWRLWRVIADRNEINDVRQIQPGTILIIPELPLQRSEFEAA
jgi:nucleoid-associated protein YgaU